MILAFVAGLLASHWLERLLLRIAIKVTRNTKVAQKVRDFAGVKDVHNKGKIISLKELDAIDRMNKFRNPIEALDYERGEMQED